MAFSWYIAAFCCQEFSPTSRGSLGGVPGRVEEWIFQEIPLVFCRYMGVSKNNGTPKLSILIGFSIINHQFWGTPIFGNTHIVAQEVVAGKGWLFVGIFAGTI